MNHLSRFIRRPLGLVLAGFAALVTEAAVASSQEVQPPKAAVAPHEVRTDFGSVRVDPYFWLRDDTRSDPKVLDYLRAENQYADGALAAMSGLETTVRKELAERVPAQDSSVPFLENGYWYYTRFLPGKEYPILARKKGTLAATEEVLLDESERAPQKGYYSVGSWAVSPDGRWLAWTEDHVGRRQYELHTKDLRTARISGEVVTGVSSDILWGGDNKTLLYVVNDKELRPHWLMAHVVGTATGSDPVIFEESDDTFYSMLVRTNDKRFLCLDGFSLVASEWRCAPVDSPTHFQVITARTTGHLYDVDHSGEHWYIRTNLEAPNYRIVSMADGDLARGRSAWHELVPTRNDTLVESIRAFSGYLAIEERFEANRRIVLRTDDGKTREVPADEPAFTMTLAHDQESQGRWVRYDYESLATPTITREINVDSGEQRVLKKKVVSGYDSARYVTERAWVTARDGARIPVSLLHRKDWKKDGKGALFQYAYGAYAYSVDARFLNYPASSGRSWHRLRHRARARRSGNGPNVVRPGPLVQQNELVYRLRRRHPRPGRAGLRRRRPRRRVGWEWRRHPDGGGGEHRSARLSRNPRNRALRRRRHDDARSLDSARDTRVRRVGQSEPEERLRLHAHAGRLTTMSVAHPYPAMYVYTGLWDSQVQYYEPTKWVAKLRASRTDHNPLVFRINMQGGHGGASGRFQQADSQAEYLTFAMWELGYRQ